MNALSHPVPTPLPPHPIDLPQSLGWAVHQAQAGYPVELTAELRAAAQSVLDRVEARCRPAASSAICEWLRPAAAAVRNPLGRDDFMARASAIAFAVADLPAGVFTLDALREGLTVWDFFPSAAAVADLLRPRAAAILAQRTGLRLLLESPPACVPDAASPITPAERTAIADQMRQVVEEMRAKVAVREVPRATPRFLTPDQLAEARRQAGIVVAPKNALVSQPPPGNIGARAENPVAEVDQAISGYPTTGKAVKPALAPSMPHSWN